VIETEVDGCSRDLDIVDASVKVDVGHFGECVLSWIATEVHELRNGQVTVSAFARSLGNFLSVHLEQPKLNLEFL
jgi:hypothetical protein